MLEKSTNGARDGVGAGREDQRVVGARVFGAGGEQITSEWSQYQDAGTYPGAVSVTPGTGPWTTLKVPANALPGQTIEMILQVSTTSSPVMTQYERVCLTVQ